MLDPRMQPFLQQRHRVAITGPHARTRTLRSTLRELGGDRGLLAGKTGTHRPLGLYNLAVAWQAPNGDIVVIVALGSTSHENRVRDMRATIAELAAVLAAPGRRTPASSERCWTLGEILRLLNVREAVPNKDAAITRIARRSEEAGAGALFLAPRDGADTRKLARRALRRGAEAAILARRAGTYKRSRPRTVFIENLDSAASILAAVRRDRLNCEVVAITGSVGKTTTKQMVGHALGGFDATYFSPGNWNTTTLHQMMNVDADVRYAVFEVAASSATSRIDAMKTMSRIIRPTIAIITNVGLSHLGQHGSRQDLRRYKLALLEGLVPGGTAILDAETIKSDPETMDYLARKAPHRMLVGADQRCDVVIEGVSLEPGAVRSRIRIGAAVHQVSLPYPFPHYAKTAAFVLAAAHALGLDVAAAAERLAGFEAPPRRLERHRVSLRDGRTFTLVDDACNSAPDSARTLLGVLSRSDRAMRRILVFGDMLELGDEAPGLHEDLAADIEKAEIDVLVTVGPLARRLGRRVDDPLVLSFEDVNEALEPLDELIRDGDLVALKASRDVNFLAIVKFFARRGAMTPVDG